MRKLYVTVATVIAVAMSAGAAEAQILGQNLKLFVGYSNIQAEGLLNQNTDLPGLFNQGFFRDRTTLHGVNAELTGAFHGVGLTGDFSFNRNTRDSDVVNGIRNSISTDLYYFVAGPSFHYSGESHFEPFARIMAGGARTNFGITNRTSLPGGSTSSSFDVGSTSFAATVGGGFDLRLSDGPYRIRLIQIDYAPVFLRDKTIQILQQAGAIASGNLNGQRQDNLRVSVGFVF